MTPDLKDATQEIQAAIKALSFRVHDDFTPLFTRRCECGCGGRIYKRRIESAATEQYELRFVSFCRGGDEPGTEWTPLEDYLGWIGSAPFDQEPIYQAIQALKSAAARIGQLEASLSIARELGVSARQGGG